MTPSGPGDFLFLKTGWLLLGPHLVSCDPMSLSESSSFLVSVLLLLVLHIDCDVTYIFIVISMLADYLHVTISPLSFKVVKTLIVLVIQLVDKTPKLLILPFTI